MNGVTSTKLQRLSMAARSALSRPAFRDRHYIACLRRRNGCPQIRSRKWLTPEYHQPA